MNGAQRPWARAQGFAFGFRISRSRSQASKSPAPFRRAPIKGSVLGIVNFGAHSFVPSDGSAHNVGRFRSYSEPALGWVRERVFVIGHWVHVVTWFVSPGPWRDRRGQAGRRVVPGARASDKIAETGSIP